MGQQGQQMLMNPQSTTNSMMTTMQDPQKMMSAFVGPSTAGIKPPETRPADLKKPTNSAITPTPAADLQQKYTLNSSGDVMDPTTMRFLAMLAGGGR